MEICFRAGDVAQKCFIVVRAWLAAGLAGALCIDLYLSATQVLFFHGSVAALQMWFASNLFGRAAFTYGATGAWLGFMLHLVVSLGWAAVFVGLMKLFPRAGRVTIAAGVVFGIMVFSVMTFVIVPLDAAPKGSMSLVDVVNGLIATTLFFGIPIAVVSRA